MHTNKRLTQYGILKLTDEIKLQEAKIIWKWDKKKLPKSLSTILEEKQDRLRGRRFITMRGSKPNSIHCRLVKAAGKIEEISKCTTIENLTKMVREIALDQYKAPCRTRNCFICRNSN